MPVATALDLVDVCLRWATARKILKADPVEGSRTIFSLEESKKKFQNKKEYLGIAGNIFWLCLKQWAVANQKVTMMEAKDYAQKNFKTSELLLFYSYLDCQDAASSQPPPEAPPQLDFQVPVAVIATGSTAEEAIMGPIGGWRKISADPQTYGYLYALHELIMITPKNNATNKVIDLMANLALHCPMDLYAFGLQPDIEKKIYLKSFQLMEDFRKREEEQAPSGWKICCLWNQARSMIDGNKDINDGLVDLFGGIEFAASSEYNVQNLKQKKLAKDCLIFYDRAVTSGAEDIMPRARIDLVPKNALDQLSKMVKISQVTAAAFEDADLMEGFKAVVELLFVRMKIGLCDEDIKVRSLVREEMPKVLGIVKLVKHLLEKYAYSGKHEKSILASLGSALSWHERGSLSSEVLMVCSGSCRNLYAFICGLYQGKRDYVFMEIMEENVAKKRSGSSYAEHGKFNLLEDVDAPYQREKLQLANAAKFAAGIEPADTASRQLAASSQGAPPVNVEDDDDDAMEVDDDDDDSATKDSVV